MESNNEESQETRWWSKKMFEINNVSLEHIQYIRELFNLLQGKDTRIKGVVIVGSTMRGYANTESDIDIDVILKEEKKGVKVLEHCEKLIKEYNSTRSRFNVHVAQAIDYNHLIDKEERMNYKSVAPLLFPGLGEIEHVRKIIREKLAGLNEKEKADFKKKVLAYFSSKDYTDKMIDRGHLSDGNDDLYTKERNRVVGNRFDRLFT